MEEQLITFETAKLAKEKGFDVPVINFYTACNNHYLTSAEGYQTERLEKSNWNDGMGSYPTRAERVDCSAPTQTELQDWLREKHNIIVVCLPALPQELNSYDKLDELYWNCSIYHNLELVQLSVGTDLGNNPKDVLEKGLQEALKLIK